jgi:hypothetical protein
VVVHHVVHDEWIIWSQLKRRIGVQTPLVNITCLKREPNLLKSHSLGLTNK